MTMNLFTELRRRNVFRVGAAYLVVGWLLLQVADVLLGGFGAPDWVFKSFAAVLILGFPVALFLAWAFELTPEGVKATEDVPESASITGRTGQRLNYLIIAGLVVALAYFIWERQHLTQQFEQATATPQTDRPTVAVLPFVNMSADSDQDYFSDGITEEIINRLVAQPALKVVSRTSAFSLENTELPLPQIAAKLGASYIVEGSVRRSGDTLRITAQLIEAASDTHLWSDTYDRSMGDIFAIQDELSEAIAIALGDKLGFTASRAVTQQRIENLEAYEDFLRARSLLRERDVAPAERLFASVVQRAPDFADAWALYAISLIYIDSGIYGRQGTPAPVTQGGAARFMARRAAQRAFELAPDAAMTQYALAQVARAELREFDELLHYRKALATDPENPLVLEDFNETLNQFGVFEGRREGAERLVDADPLWHVGRAVAEEYRLLAGDMFEEVLNTYDELLAARPDAVFIYGLRVQILVMTRQWEKAKAAQAMARTSVGARPESVDNHYLEIDLIALRDWVENPDRGAFAESPFMATTDAEHHNFLEGLYATFAEPDEALELALSLPRHAAQAFVPFATRYGGEPLWNHPRIEETIRGIEHRWDLQFTRIWREFGWPRYCRPLGEDDFECGVPE